jgi:hypothetical protein
MMSASRSAMYTSRVCASVAQVQILKFHLSPALLHNCYEKDSLL